MSNIDVASLTDEEVAALSDEVAAEQDRRVSRAQAFAAVSAKIAEYLSWGGKASDLAVLLTDPENPADDAGTTSSDHEMQTEIPVEVFGN